MFSLGESLLMFYHVGSWWPPKSLSFERCSRWILIRLVLLLRCSACGRTKPNPYHTHRIPAKSTITKSRCSHRFTTVGVGDLHIAVVVT